MNQFKKGNIPWNKGMKAGVMPSKIDTQRKIDMMYWGFISVLLLFTIIYAIFR